MTERKGRAGRKSRSERARHLVLLFGDGGEWPGRVGVEGVCVCVCVCAEYVRKILTYITLVLLVHRSHPPHNASAEKQSIHVDLSRQDKAVNIISD